MHQESGTATVDGSGQAIVEIGPGRANHSWRVRRLAVLVTGVNNPVAELRVYLDEIAAARFIAGSHDGAADVSDEDLTLSANQRLIFVWSDVSPTGGTATATVTYDLTGQ